MLSFRPHHALCISFFQGKGYSREFTENMYRVIESLKENPNVKITLAGDQLCEKCPNLQNGDCVNREKVCETDRRVSQLCGFTDGEIMSANDFFSRAKEQIITCGKMKYACGECRWSDICFNN